MAFQTKADLPNLAGMSSMIQKADPFSVLGKTMSELDTILENRRGEEYIKSIDPASLQTEQGALSALQGAMTMPQATRQQLQSNYNNLMTAKKNNLDMLKAQQDMQLAQQKNLMDTSKYQREVAEQDKKDTAEYTEAQDAIVMMNEMLQGDALERAAGAFDSFTPSFGDAKVFEDNLEVLKNKNFLRNAGRISGALSEAEGNKLMNSIRALNLDMPQEQLRKNIETIRNLYSKGFEAYEQRKGIQNGLGSLIKENIPQDQIKEKRVIGGKEYVMLNDGTIKEL